MPSLTIEEWLFVILTIVYSGTTIWLGVKLNRAKEELRKLSQKETPSHRSVKQEQK